MGQPLALRQAERRDSLAGGARGAGLSEAILLVICWRREDMAGARPQDWALRVVGGARRWEAVVVVQLNNRIAVTRCVSGDPVTNCRDTNLCPHDERLATVYTREARCNRSCVTKRKNTRVRYIAGPPADLRRTQPSQAIIPVTPSIGLVTSAPDRRVLHDNRWLSGHCRLRGA